MDNINFTINYMGNGTAPLNWKLKNRTKMQRLYYIKDGIGYYRNENNFCKIFIPGMIYLFPYNYSCEFINSPENPINHIYFDFISIPPIISREPIIYDPNNYPELRMLFNTFEIIFGKTPILRSIETKNINLPETNRGNIDGKRQVILQLFKTIMSILSYEYGIPFTKDIMICDTLEYIRENYMKPLNITELAERTGYEKNYFIKRFKSIMIQTPYAYLRSYRLHRAVELILDGNTYECTAEMVGYTEASSLAHALKSITL